jgi:hypothetical protein
LKKKKKEKMNACESKIINETIGFDLVFYFSLANHLLGAITNTICILIFIKIVKEDNNRQSNMFCYLLMKSIVDLIYLLGKSIISLNNIDQLKDGFLSNLFYIILQYYVCYVAKLASSFFEIFASLDCLVLITKHFKFFIKKMAIYVVTTVTIIYTCLFYIITPFGFKVYQCTDSQNRTFYKYDKAHLYQTVLYSIYIRIHSMQRDVIHFILIVIINILIMRQLRKTTVRRRTLAKAQSLLVSTALNAERNKIKMILFMFLIHSLHFPIILFHFNLIEHNRLNNSIVRFILDISYTLYIIPYSLYNNNFKNSIKNAFNFWFCRT